MTLILICVDVLKACVNQMWPSLNLVYIPPILLKKYYYSFVISIV